MICLAFSYFCYYTSTIMTRLKMLLRRSSRENHLSWISWPYLTTMWNPELFIKWIRPSKITHSKIQNKMTRNDRLFPIIWCVLLCLLLWTSIRTFKNVAFLSLSKQVSEELDENQGDWGTIWDRNRLIVRISKPIFPLVVIEIKKITVSFSSSNIYFRKIIYNVISSNLCYETRYG